MQYLLSPEEYQKLTNDRVAIEAQVREEYKGKFEKLKDDYFEALGSEVNRLSQYSFHPALSDVVKAVKRAGEKLKLP